MGKIVFFSIKNGMYTDAGWAIGQIIIYWKRESQIFEIQQAHPRMILEKVTPGR